MISRALLSSFIPPPSVTSAELRNVNADLVGHLRLRHAARLAKLEKRSQQLGGLIELARQLRFQL